MILIDQHAADERVRVERFLKDLCFGFLNHELPIHESNADVSSAGVETRMLTPPFPVLLTRHEATQIVQSADLQNTLERWGFSFSNLDKCKLPTVDDLTNNVFQRKPQSSGYIQLLASSVPEILADKASLTMSPSSNIILTNLQLISGDELRDVLKGFITHLDLVGCPSTQLPPSSQRSQDENLTWQRAMRWCPKELLDLVNSKACRGQFAEGLLHITS